MPSRLPLFPLKVVLFPGTPLPLRIFEPRYRQLLADCLQGDQRFGITPMPRPGPGAVGCVAHIRATHQLPDGRYNIVVLGEQRFTVLALLDTNAPYLIASVERFEDLPGTEPSPTERAELEHLANRYREAMALLTDTPSDRAAWDEDPAAFSFQVAALLEAPLEVKEQLLAQRSTRERTRALIALMPGLLRNVAERAQVHVRARSNGAGGSHPDIVSGL
ncbi:MAG TPA: LON peptidase substrate-binding domain-containing protein [Gemmatimonadales bacterium]|jgi:Lon protease-like protein|nr:LON peptidase substrate-binding domain-containing protein [Gemmatimonadales bacterium]